MEEVKVQRPVLTEEQAQKVADFLASMFPAGCEHTPEKMEDAALIAIISSELLMKAAMVHRKEQVPWASMCWSAFLPAVSAEMRRSIDLLQKMLGVLCVNVHPPKKIKRRGGFPNFIPAEVLS